MKNEPIRRFTIFSVAIFILLPLSISLLMYVRMVGALRGYTVEQVANQAEILAEIANQRLSSRLEELERIADYLRDGRVEEERMGDAVNSLLEHPNQVFSGILRLDGTPVSGQALHTSEYPAIQRAFRGMSTVRYRENEGLLFTVPVYNGSNIKYALYELFDEEALFDTFLARCYGGKGKILLADKVQEIAMPFSSGKPVDISYFQQEAVQSALDLLDVQLDTSTSAAVYCKNGSQESVMFVSDLEQPELYLVGIVPHKMASKGISNFSSMALLVFGLLLTLLTIGTFRVVSADARARESDELREAKRIAEEASQSKSVFLANMSHELRTPISAIMGMDEMILRETDEHTTRERAMDIRSASQILLGLINDVLDFSKIESGKLSIFPVEYDFVSLIRDLVMLSENRARTKSLEFELVVQPDLPIGLFGDDNRIRQVLTNLLTNAVKYTFEGSVILKVTGQKPSEDTITLHYEVIDTGIGIKQEDLPKLFIPYTRMEEARNRNVEGTGLGLTIIINLLRLMGSDLKVDSVYGQGSTFHFYLDQKILDAEPVGNIQKRMEDIIRDYEYRTTCIAPKARILMVDDNSMNRKIFTSLLKQTKIPVTTVSSGQKCLDIVQKEHFDLIFMDHLMPKMDGVETLGRLKSLENNLCKDTPVIALTANAFSGAKERYLSMGFDGFLSKPIMSEKLEKVISTMLPQEYLEEIPKEQEETEGSSVSAEALPEIEGVNWEYALLHTQDTELLLGMLRDFYRNIDTEYHAIAELADHTGTEDGLTGYRIRVHALKSTSAMIGILSISELSRLLEDAARKGDIETIQNGNLLLLEELLNTKERLRAYTEQKREKQALTDSSQLLSLLEKLLEALSDMDIQAADSSMEEINGFSYEDSSIQEAINQLAGLVSTLDFDQAAELARQLANRLS